MLEDKDIKRIIKANPELFSSKKDFEDFRDEIRKNFSDLHTSIDKYSQKADTYFQEMVMLSHKVERLERWINQIAEKVQVSLKA